MHILGAIIGFIGMALFWWYRIKDAKRAVDDITNTVSKFRGSRKRKALRQQANLSPITAIDNPLVAAATLMIAIQSEEFVLGENDEDDIGKILLNLANQKQVEEAMIYAKWAYQQVPYSEVIIDQLGTYLNNQLTDEEKNNFLDLLKQADDMIGGCHNLANTLAVLSDKLNIDSSLNQ